MGDQTAVSNIYDPYVDFVMSQLLAPHTAIKLTRAERTVIVAAIRTEVFVNKDIRKHLIKKARAVVAEMVAMRRNFPVAE